MDNLLEIKNLHATIDGKEILKGIDLTVKPGEIHALMGQNGAGKSTLARVLCGDILPTSGSIYLNEKKLLDIIQITIVVSTFSINIEHCFV